jgi:hypothetical protein
MANLEWDLPAERANLKAISENPDPENSSSKASP